MRLEEKIAVIIGAGQTPGETVGNGRATALLFAREGARVLAVDRDMASAEETARLIQAEGGEALAFEADVTDEASLQAAVAQCVARWGRLDILHNNVGISVAGGDAAVTEITTEAFDRVMAVNLRGTVMACKHALPIMREQASGAIRQYLVHRRGGELSMGRIQGEQVSHGGLYQAVGDSECRIRCSCKRHPARIDGHTHGRRHACARLPPFA